MHMNPALKELEVLVGDWTMELSNASFIPDPSAVIRGSASFEWIEDGGYLVIHQGRKGIDANYATWIIGADESSTDYSVLYFDDRKVSRIYEMSFKNGVWKIWRNAANFSQRFEGVLSNDGKTIAAQWEKSSDGKKWEHDFNIKYIKS